MILAEEFVEQVEVGCYWCGGTGEDPEEEMPWHDCEECNGVGTVIVNRGDE